jgi:hypothetical protein
MEEIKYTIEHELACFSVSKAFLKKIKFFIFFSLLQINIFLVFSDHFDMLVSKIIFKK